MKYNNFTRPYKNSVVGISRTNKTDYSWYMVRQTTQTLS
jgi:regulator of PEP synthase PpsR (kinase-PPPase family)